MQLFAGANYEIVAEGDLAVCRVWKRPDLDLEAGARCAVEKIAHFRQLASGDTAGMLFDLTAAPQVTGPKTQDAIGQMVSSFERAGKPIAIVAGSAIGELQLGRLARTFAPRAGRVFLDKDAALAWLRSPSARTAASADPPID